MATGRVSAHAQTTEAFFHVLVTNRCTVCVPIRLEPLILETEHLLHCLSEGRVDNTVEDEISREVDGLHHVGDDLNCHVCVVRTEIFPKQIGEVLE